MKKFIKIKIFNYLLGILKKNKFMSFQIKCLKSQRLKSKSKK